MKRSSQVLATVGLASVAYVSLRLATSARYAPHDAAVYVLLWIAAVAAVCLIGMLRRAKH
jgi:hypothetical protein